jgi:integrase
LAVKVLRICLGEAVRQGLLALNPAVRVKLLKSTAESKRRAFTLNEIKRILRACGNDTEWRGLVLFGLYLGQGLGDLAKLTWRSVDLDTGEVAFSTRKTGRRIVLPLVQPVGDYLASLPASDRKANCARHARVCLLAWRIETRSDSVQFIVHRTALFPLCLARHRDVRYLDRRKLASQGKQLVHCDPGSNRCIAQPSFANCFLHATGAQLRNVT